MTNRCLNCQKWARDKEDTVIGVCLVCNEYRFQYEDCERWAQGEERPPHREGNAIRQRRARLLDDEIERLNREGRTNGQIADELKISKDRVRVGLRERGLTAVLDRTNRRAIVDDKLTEVVDWYKQDKSLFWISKKTGYSTSTISRALVREGLK